MYYNHNSSSFSTVTVNSTVKLDIIYSFFRTFKFIFCFRNYRKYFLFLARISYNSSYLCETTCTFQVVNFKIVFLSCIILVLANVMIISNSIFSRFLVSLKSKIISGLNGLLIRRGIMLCGFHLCSVSSDLMAQLNITNKTI